MGDALRADHPFYQSYSQVSSIGSTCPKCRCKSTAQKIVGVTVSRKIGSGNLFTFGAVATYTPTEKQI